MIKCHKQTEGLGYFDSYSPMTRINSIRMVLAIIALRNIEVHQMDVKEAFVNGELDEEIYMEKPFWFETRKESLYIGEIIVWAKTSTKIMA